MDNEGKMLRLLVVEDSQRDAEMVVREVQHGGFDLTWKRVDTAAAMKAALDAGAHAAAAGSMYVFYGPRRAVLIHVPLEHELYEMGVYRDA